MPGKIFRVLLGNVNNHVFLALLLVAIYFLTSAHLADYQEAEQKTAQQQMANNQRPYVLTCADGWASPSIGHPGACSWHGGVSYTPVRAQPDTTDWFHWANVVDSQRQTLWTSLLLVLSFFCPLANYYLIVRQFYGPVEYPKYIENIRYLRDYDEIAPYQEAAPTRLASTGPMQFWALLLLACLTSDWLASGEKSAASAIIRAFSTDYNTPAVTRQASDAAQSHINSSSQQSPAVPLSAPAWKEPATYPPSAWNYVLSRGNGTYNIQNDQWFVQLACAFDDTTGEDMARGLIFIERRDTTVSSVSDNTHSFYLQLGGYQVNTQDPHALAKFWALVMQQDEKHLNLVNVVVDGATVATFQLGNLPILVQNAGTPVCFFR